MEQKLYAIDQRNFIRVPVAVKVILFHNDLPVMNTETINISRDGMLLDTGRTVYQLHDQMEIEFQVDEGPTNQWYRLSAEVVHASKYGIGLKLHKPSTMQSLMSQMMLNRIYHSIQ
jgi:hypothetical protein